MASQNLTPFHHSKWEAEKSFINNQLDFVDDSSAKADKKNIDGLGSIMEHVRCSSYKINLDHPHVIHALSIIKDYPFPKTLQEFHTHFRFREWDFVCETLLVAVRLKRLVPNDFQHFLIGLYIHEYRPICCCSCGATPGYWCGECFLNIFVIFINFNS